MVISSHELGQDASDQAGSIGKQAVGQAGRFGKKAGGKLARKAAGKAVKVIKKLVVNLVKKILVAVVKAVVGTVGIKAIVILLALLIFSAIIMSIPSADWFLKGGERTAAEEAADRQYEQQFRDLALNSVAPIDNEEASDVWKDTLKNIVMPNWAIPASLVRYQISHSNSKIELPDPKEMFSNLEPSFSYTDVTDDIRYTRSVISCYRDEAVKDKDGNEVKDENGKTVTERIYDPPTESTTSSKMPKRKILSKVEIPFGVIELPSVKKYFPGGAFEPNGLWEDGGSSSSGNCTTTTYHRWEQTMVDDRGVPESGFDSDKFKAFLGSRGVKENHLDEFFEYLMAMDPNFPVELYKGMYVGGGAYTNATYTFTGIDVDGWVWPIAIDYRGINSGFGPRWGRFHYGIDLGGRGWPNAPILAARAGVVIWAGDRGNYGNLVVLAHDDGLQTRYAHLSAITVKVGEQVSSGQQIGKQGSTGHSTGPHLHFEVAIPNSKNPLARMSDAEKVFDPMIFLGPVKQKGG